MTDIKHNYDFDITCTYYDDDSEWDFECTYQAHSVRALKIFGTGKLASLNLSMDPLTIAMLQKDYPRIPGSTMVLDLVVRYKDRDKGNKLKGIGMTMMCSLVNHLRAFRGITHVYLVATTTPAKENRLINFYKSFGFMSIDPRDPKKMIAPIRSLKYACMTRLPGRNVPVLLEPHRDTPNKPRIFARHTDLTPTPLQSDQSEDDMDI